eukprot:1147396-Pelagomonas_calceolata.AAC.2
MSGKEVLIDVDAQYPRIHVLESTSRKVDVCECRAACTCPTTTICGPCTYFLLLRSAPLMSGFAAAVAKGPHSLARLR